MTETLWQADGSPDYKAMNLCPQCEGDKGGPSSDGSWTMCRQCGGTGTYEGFLHVMAEPKTAPVVPPSPPPVAQAGPFNEAGFLADLQVLLDKYAPKESSTDSFPALDGKALFTVCALMLFQIMQANRT